jgi:PadR family transcriptional regulator, regulatory protein PadR
VPEPTTDVLRGTLDLLVLKTLALGPMHGWGVTQAIQQLSSDALRVGQGSLYPALHRLEQQGWIDSEWAISDQNQRVKLYRLTTSGRAALRAETASWRRYVRLMDMILEAS